MSNRREGYLIRRPRPVRDSKILKWGGATPKKIKLFPKLRVWLIFFDFFCFEICLIFFDFFWFFLIFFEFFLIFFEIFWNFLKFFDFFWNFLILFWNFLIFFDFFWNQKKSKKIKLFPKLWVWLIFFGVAPPPTF